MRLEWPSHRISQPPCLSQRSGEEVIVVILLNTKLQGELIPETNPFTTKKVQKLSFRDLLFLGLTLRTVFCNLLSPGLIDSAARRKPMSGIQRTDVITTGFRRRGRRAWPSPRELPSSPSGGAEDARWTPSGVCPPCLRVACCAPHSSFLAVEPGGKEWPSDELVFKISKSYS